MSFIICTAETQGLIFIWKTGRHTDLLCWTRHRKRTTKRWNMCLLMFSSVTAVWASAMGWMRKTCTGLTMTSAWPSWRTRSAVFWKSAGLMRTGNLPETKGLCGILACLRRLIMSCPLRRTAGCFPCTFALRRMIRKKKLLFPTIYMISGKTSLFPLPVLWRKAKMRLLRKKKRLWIKGTENFATISWMAFAWTNPTTWQWWIWRPAKRCRKARYP